MAPSHVRVAARLYVMQLTGENAGQPLSSEITYPGCRPRGPKGKAVHWPSLNGFPLLNFSSIHS